jgi:NADPH-dependent 7-cyano-7-deazaguanine reductase QueF
MAAQIIPFPAPRVSTAVSFDETLEAFRRLAAMHDQIHDEIREAVWTAIRPEFHAILRRAGLVCPGDAIP